MASRRKVLAAALAALLFPGAAPAAEEGPYPIWWSPSLELESLDKIDQRLQRKLWLDGGEIEVYKRARRGGKKKIIDTCVSAIELSKTDYWAPTNQSQQIQLFQLAKCRAIEMLKKARPARRSYVRDFVLDRDALDYLPAMVGLTASCRGICWKIAANERRIPWGKVLDILRFDIRSDVEMELRTDVYSTEVKILVRADFNDDGLEDLLIWADADATEGTWGTTKIFVLSREAPESVMWVLDAERYLCRKYECDADYDFSKFLC